MSENKKRGSLFDEIVGVKQPTINRAVQASMEAYHDKHGNFGGLEPKGKSIWDEMIAEAGIGSRAIPADYGISEIPQVTANVDPAYLFNEGAYLKEVKAHVDKTYVGHYSGQYQATSIIIDAGHGTGFNIGNIIKYAKRYGKKDGYNKADLMKIIHYALMQMYVQDTEKL